MIKISELSVFLPAYNEESNILKSINQVVGVLKKKAKKWEVIVIDDGSTDKTSEIVKKLIDKDKRIRIVTHTPNQGYGAALQSGFYTAKYRWIAYTDADLQFDFSDIERFIEKQQRTNADLVIGCYQNRKVHFFRILGSKFYCWLVFFLFGVELKDADCAFKLVRKEVFKKISKLEGRNGPSLCNELLIKAKAKNYNIVQIPVRHFTRLNGESKGVKPKVILGSFIDLLKLRIDWKSH